jgi:hypothetical protein
LAWPPPFESVRPEDRSVEEEPRDFEGEAWSLRDGAAGAVSRRWGGEALRVSGRLLGCSRGAVVRGSAILR